MKRDFILNALRESIASGSYRPGAKLPTEQELAEMFGVARGTVRKSLGKLEKESLIERIKSKGTFVLPPRDFDDEKVITFFIPCPDYMRSRRDHIFAAFSDTLCGAVRAAAEKGFQIRTLPFSRTNDNMDIDKDSFRLLGRNSRVIVYNYWYRTAFKLMTEKEMRVGFIRQSEIPNDEFAVYHSRWKNTLFDMPPIFDMLYATLRKRGCRKVLSAGVYNSDPLNMRSSLARHSAAANGIELLELDCPNTITEREHHALAAKIHDMYQREHFDALFLDPSENLLMLHSDFYTLFDLPHQVKIMLFRDDVRYLSTSPQIASFAFDNELSGYECAAALCEDEYKPEVKLIKVGLNDRESIGGEHCSTESGRCNWVADFSGMSFV